jgi:hypothetical protein
MKKILLVKFAFLCLLPNAALAEINKCVEKGKVTYSNSPCPVGASGTVLELRDSGKTGDEGIVLSGKPASSGTARANGVPPGVSPETLETLEKSLESLNKGGPPTGESSGMIGAVKKQIELLLRQRDPGNNTAERAGRENGLE